MRNRRLDELQRALEDKRSRRVVFVSHCILNENVRYLGGAARRGSVDEVVAHPVYAHWPGGSFVTSPITPDPASR